MKSWQYDATCAIIPRRFWTRFGELINYVITATYRWYTATRTVHGRVGVKKYEFISEMFRVFFSLYNSRILLSEREYAIYYYYLYFPPTPCPLPRSTNQKPKARPMFDVHTKYYAKRIRTVVYIKTRRGTAGIGSAGSLRTVFSRASRLHCTPSGTFPLKMKKIPYRGVNIKYFPILTP